MDIHYILNSLSKESTIFSNESEFQFLLAWKIKELIPNAEIIFERYTQIDEDIKKKSFIDLVVKLNDKFIPIELKYMTTNLEYEEYSLMEHGAMNNRSYDVLKDVERIEKYCNDIKNNASTGYVIVVTNNKYYWKDYGDLNIKKGKFKYLCFEINNVK